MGKERRHRVWPAAVLAAVFAVIGAWAFNGVQQRMGLATDDVKPNRTGSAEVRSCASDPLHMWLVDRCDVDVRWPGKPEPVRERVLSVRPLSGTVNVEERLYSKRRGGTTRELTMASDPKHVDGTLFFLMAIGFLAVSMGIGFFAGWQLERLLPEPPPEKLALRSERRTRRRGSKR